MSEGNRKRTEASGPFHPSPKQAKFIDQPIDRPQFSGSSEADKVWIETSLHAFQVADSLLSLIRKLELLDAGLLEASCLATAFKLVNGLNHYLYQKTFSCWSARSNFPLLPNIVSPQQASERPAGEISPHPLSIPRPISQIPPSRFLPTGEVNFALAKLEDFEIGPLLGTGSFARVHLARHRHSNHNFSVKILNKAEMVKLRQTERVLNEKKILQSLSHPFIVKLHASFKNKDNLYLIMELVTGGELFTYIRRSEKFSESVTRMCAAEIVCALEYMHANKILYRDLKPENLLISQTGHIKIVDFGFAKRILGRTQSVCGTEEYMAPEMVTNRQYSFSIDWWALGVLIYEMLVGVPPFGSGSFGKISENICKQQIELPYRLSEEVKDLVRKLLTKDPDFRLGTVNGCADVKQHPWFKGINWTELQELKFPGPLYPNINPIEFIEEDEVERRSRKKNQEKQPGLDYDKIFEDF